MITRRLGLTSSDMRTREPDERVPRCSLAVWCEVGLEKTGEWIMKVLIAVASKHGDAGETAKFWWAVECGGASNRGAAGAVLRSGGDTQAVGEPGKGRHGGTRPHVRTLGSVRCVRFRYVAPLHRPRQLDPLDDALSGADGLEPAHRA